MSFLQQLTGMGVRPQGMTADSRKLHTGDLFVAYPGEKTDGRKFISQAIQNGACAVLWERNENDCEAEVSQVPNLPVMGLREQISTIAGEFFGQPSHRLWMIGVTGTNGKTSCSHWLADCFNELGNKAAIVGTLGSGLPGALDETANTTPDSIVLQRTLANFVDQNIESVAMEVSSHGLVQGRVNGIKFDVAILTNLSRDHLDYHVDMTAYAEVKKKLLLWPTLKCAVVNVDDEFGQLLALELHKQGKKVMTYGLNGGAVSCASLQFVDDGMVMNVMTPWGNAETFVKVIGSFNASNVLAVLSALLASNVSLENAVSALQSIRSIPGRMQQLGGGSQQPLVVVDYAHTPDALSKVITSLRERTKGRLICVFGSGGDRDHGKRRLMGEVVSRLADMAVVTSDNPRHEMPRAIIDEIVAGMSTKNYLIKEDRFAAIAYSIQHAVEGDVVLIAGKGHENYQQIGDEKLPFNDAEISSRFLERDEL